MPSDPLPPRSFDVTLPVAPYPKERARIAPAEYERAGAGRVKIRAAHGYQAPNTAEYENKLRWFLRCAKIPVLQGDVTVTVTFWHEHERGKRSGRGDLDNYVKALFDAANKIAWDDDRQVTELTARLVKCPAGVTPHITFAAWEAF